MSTLLSVELGVLGPLQVRQDGAPVAIPGAKPRAVLTMLGLHDGSVVSADALVELLWGEDPPRTAAKALQTHISSLRRALGDGFVVTQGAGWALAESQVDASRYKRAARLGRDAAAAGDTSQAVARFEEALALWRGIPDLPDGRRGTSEKTRWIEGHAALVEDRADALLATGRAAEVVGDLEAAVADAPLRERRWGQLMLALYRAGRQGEALGAYQRARTLLADELGVDPGPELRRLEAAIVAQDTSLDSVVTQHLPSVTRAVTFLLTDIEGSTAAWEADAEAMAPALARHDELVEQVVTSRGGRLIKTRGEGDATFSVFERPSAAASAAIELQDAVTHEPWALRDPLRVRMALHTGEVELRDGDYFGRAVNRVARLRSLADGGQILCSGATAELVIDSLADDVMLTDLGMRHLKNLSRPEHVFELRLETTENRPESPALEAPMQRPGLPAVLVGPGPFVGRGGELERLLSAWQATLGGGVRTVLIAGEPGVGKTRLAGEWAQRAYDQGAVVLYGRCDEDLGAPYQPFAEALRSLMPCVGVERLRGLRGVEALLPLTPGLTDVLPDLAPAAHADPDTERYALFDAVVALLEIASASMPVLLILDDLHWAAKPTLLLLRHLLRFGDHARVQIVGTYRSTDLDRSHPLAAMLADLHRDGIAHRLNLGGLDEDDVTAYVVSAGYDDEELAHALASVTGGNPFFLIEALRHVDESGGVWDQSTLPQGVREAVSRRLSRLPAETNTALAAAAVVGSRFALELVEQVVGTDLIDAFDEARKAGIVIEEPGGNYRFNHALVRQSLLAELASMRRMRLHQRIATTLETLPGAGDELLAELAHHYFECAWAGNAAKAVFYCRRAADQAMARLAYEGAADLYHDALHALEELDDELPDRDDQTAELLVARCEALLAAGDVASAAGAVAQLQAATVDSARLAAWATCFDGQLSMLIHPERLDEVEAALGAAAAKLAELDDAAGEATAHTVRASCLARLGRIADCEVALDDALNAARRAREHRRVNAVLAGAPLAALWGPNPVPRAGGRCLDVVRLLRITTDSPAVEATSTRCQAVLEAFRGRTAAARRMIDSARRTASELGLRHALLEVEQFAGIVELVAGDPTAAEPHLRKAYNGFRRMGLDADTAETAALLGRVCLALGRDGEADELCSQSEQLAGHALKASIAWRTLRAQLLARAGDHGEARRVAEAAVGMAERTDALVDHGDACLTLATVLNAADDVAGARAAAEQAVGLYERKGAAALVERARLVLGERVKPSAPPRPEASRVELDNACVRAGERVTSAINREAWDEFEQLFALDGFIESRRKIVGFGQIDVPSGEFPQLNRSVLEKVPMRVTQMVTALRGERLALARLLIGADDVSPGAPHDEFLLLYGIDDDGQISLQVWFDLEDMDAAIAELDAAHARYEEKRPPEAPVVGLDNACVRVGQRLIAAIHSEAWDAFEDLYAPEGLVESRRKIAGFTQTPSADWAHQARRAVEKDGLRFNQVFIAVRGECLALARVVTGTADESPGAPRDEFLSILGIDEEGRVALQVWFDLEDFDAAIAELDIQYLAGEAAAYSQTWAAVSKTYAAVNRQRLPLSPDCVSIDHRQARAFAPGELTAYMHATWEIAPNVTGYLESVHRLNRCGAVVTHVVRGSSQGGFDAEWREVILGTFDGGLISRAELFDEADLDAAIVRFEQLSQQTHRLQNAATRAAEHFLARYAMRDWDGMAELLVDEMSAEDRRRVVNSGIRHGRDVEIANWRGTADVLSTNMDWAVVATRGERVALLRFVFAGDGPDPVAFQVSGLSVLEVNADEKIAARTTFDLEDLDTAIAELDARYIAREAAPYADTWSAIAQGYGTFNRRDGIATTPDWVNIDHRRAVAVAPGELTDYVHAAWELEQDVSIYVEAVHRLNSLGAVISHATRATSRQGFDAEWRMVLLVTVDGDVVNHCEVFDEADVDAALARFDQLSRPAPRLENTASQAYERFRRYFAARDWAGMTQLLTADTSVDDHRRVVNAEIRRGRDVEIANMQAFAEIGAKKSTASVIATRGERLVLCRTCISGEDQQPDAFNIEFLNLVEITDDKRIAARSAFDLDDFDAAVAELDTRYIAGEAAAHANTWSVVAGVHDMFNRHEYPPEDWVTVDHRRGTPFAASDMTSAVHTLFDLTPDFKVHIEAVHQINRFGAVITNNAHGSSPDGLGVEWRMVMLLIADGDRLTRCEVFDETDVGAAITRLEELQPQPPRLENAASQVVERFWTCLTNRDWAAMAETMSRDFSSHDHRRVVNAGVLRGRDVNIANMRAVAEVGFEGLASTVIATRGQRLVLSRIRSSVHGFETGQISADMLGMLEIDADNRFTAGAVFDGDDIDAALEELDARYLAGEAAAHARTWSVIMHACAALNSREIFATTADFVDIDHRSSAAIGSGDLKAYIRVALNDGVYTVYIEAVHRLNDLGAVLTLVSNGTSQEGFDGEWRMADIFTVEGDLISRCEIFDEADLDAALARFDQISRPAPRLENAASQAYERILACMAGRDWDALAETVAQDVSVADRRRVVNAGIRHGRDAGIEDLRVAADIGFTYTMFGVMATRGERLALVRSRASGRDPGTVQNDALSLIEIDANGRVAGSVVFDLDDFDAAIAELDTRYLAGEAAAHANTWSVVSGTNARFNRHELPATTPDSVYIDHRPLVSIEGVDLAASVRAIWDLTSDTSAYIEAVHQLNELGAVATQVLKMTSQEGFDAELRLTYVIVVEGDLLSRVEVFDEADLAAALAHFDELTGKDQPK